MPSATDVPVTTFHEAIGEATSAWQALESALCDIFTRTLVCSIGRLSEQNYRLVSTIFYGSTNFRGVLEMISNVLGQAEIADEHTKEWNSIRNRSNDLYKRRNIMAHGSVWVNSDGIGFRNRLPILQPVSPTAAQLRAGVPFGAVVPPNGGTSNSPCH
jgi:hypothetical protein